MTEALICSESECPARVKTRGLCQVHYGLVMLGEELAEREPGPPRPARSVWLREDSGRIKYADLHQVSPGHYLVTEEVMHQLMRATGWQLVAIEDDVPGLTRDLRT